MSNFKNTFSFDMRHEEAAKMKFKYPDRIPVIVEPSTTNRVLPNIDKKKYLVPHDLTVGQFIHVIRKRIKLDSNEAIFIFVNNKIIPPPTLLMINIYEEYKDGDGFLYIVYTGENTFGKKKNI